jgi:hypothetical protein
MPRKREPQERKFKRKGEKTNRERVKR